jgi:hypothetical protein
MRKIVLLATVCLLIVAATPVFANDFSCMDCACKFKSKPDGSLVPVCICCMSDSQGRCFGGYQAIWIDVGWGCLVDENSVCNPSSQDTNCGKQVTGVTAPPRHELAGKRKVSAITSPEGRP